MNKTILVINSGSSSLKFSLLDTTTHNILASGLAEELKTDHAKLTIKTEGKKEIDELTDSTYAGAMKRLFAELEERNLKDSVEAIGHRVVTGIDKFTEPTLLTPQIVDQIEALKPFAPLHNPAAAEAMRACMAVMPGLPQVAVFDTAFHSTMPERAYRYAVPDSWYEKHGVRKYGFHGTSYKYICARAAKELNIDVKDSAFVIAHLGSGASICAALNGKSVDTTMGFTPLDGIVMSTRSGAIDPAIVSYMMKELDKSADEIIHSLNHDSGLLGLSCLSSDQREISVAACNGDKKCILALDAAAYSIAKYIASMMVALPRVDALIFTAGAGENSPELRASIIEYLGNFGYKLDGVKNVDTVARNGKEGIISAEGAPMVMVLPTNEELVIAEETSAVVNGTYDKDFQLNI